MLRIAGLVASLLVLLAPAPGHAVFHFSVIDEVMTGVNGDSAIQYVEIRLLLPLQGQVCHSRLTVFKCNGGGSQVLIDNVGGASATNPCLANSAAGARWIMASPSAATFLMKSGVTPDFVWDNSMTGSLPTSCGMVCWGAPDGSTLPPPNPPTWDATNPANYVDCVAYGSYNGTAEPFGNPAASDMPGDGTFSLTRMADVMFSNNFHLACPSPTNNAGVTGTFGPCTLPTTTTTASPPTITTSTSTTARPTSTITTTSATSTTRSFTSTTQAPTTTTIGGTTTTIQISTTTLPITTTATLLTSTTSSTSTTSTRSTTSTATTTTTFSTSTTMQRNECLVEIHDSSGALPDMGTLCQTAARHVCTFNLQLCLNQPREGCTPTNFTKHTFRAMGHCGPVGLLRVDSMGTSSVCGAFTGINVHTRSSGKASGRCTVRAAVRSAKVKARTDVDTVTLVCMPKGTACPSTTTTIPEPTTTTTVP